MKKFEDFSSSREISPDNLEGFEKILKGALAAQKQVSKNIDFEAIYRKACADAKRYDIPCVRELKMEDLEKLEGYYAKKLGETEGEPAAHNVLGEEERLGGSWHDRYPKNY